jgi:uncharacterized membrane protein YadS
VGRRGCGLGGRRGEADRVLLLAPVVAGVRVLRRRRIAQEGGTTSAARTPPLVPLFVLGFLAMVAFRSTGLLPAGLLDVAATLQTLALGALFGMGTAVHLRSPLRGSGPVLALPTVSTLVVRGITLVGAVTLV